jgi:hypothetical protein
MQQSRFAIRQPDCAYRFNFTQLADKATQFGNKIGIAVHFFG